MELPARVDVLELFRHAREEGIVRADPGHPPVLVDAQYESALRTTEYTVYTRDALIPGIFSKIAGVLAAKGVQILDAQIATLADGVVVDTFRVLDGDYPEREAMMQIAEYNLRQVLSLRPAP